MSENPEFTGVFSFCLLATADVLSKLNPPAANRHVYFGCRVTVDAWLVFQCDFTGMSQRTLYVCGLINTLTSVEGGLSDK